MGNTSDKDPNFGFRFMTIAPTSPADNVINSSIIPFVQSQL